MRRMRNIPSNLRANWAAWHEPGSGMTRMNAFLPLIRPGATLRLGYLALTDAAPLLVARERGLFARRGLRVRLTREIGWATVRDKVVCGELDAAPVPAPMLWAVRLGLDCLRADVLTGLVLNLHGNALTLSRRLWDAGVRTPAGFRAEARRRRGEQKLTLGVVCRHSVHHLLLLQWLRAAGVDPAEDVRIVVVPPAQTFSNLAAGTLDGYCAGEPWNTLAVQAGAGWCPAWSATLSKGQVEKVLMVRASFATERAEEHAALVAALAEACAWCDEPAHRVELATLLSHRAALNVPAAALLPALTGRFDPGTGAVETSPDFLVFAHGANVPTPARAASLQAELVAAGLVPAAAVTAALPEQLFREDLHRSALSTTQHETAPRPASLLLRPGLA